MTGTTTQNPSRRILELSGITRQFGSDPPVEALRGIDLTVNAGDWLAITGPSGAGKSTLLYILGCLDRPSAGSYRIEGIETIGLSDRQRAGLRSRKIGFVFQSFHLLPYRTVLENVMLAEVYRNQPVTGRRDRAMAAIRQVGLAHRAEFLPIRLSGGERQRVAIARALIGSPSLLLCDEPTGNLDSENSGSIMALFHELSARGLTLVIVTHDEDVASRAQRRVHIIDGRATERNADERDRTPACKDSTQIPPVMRSGISFRDLLGEALAGMMSRPTRMLLTVLGVVIGLSAMVATIGLTRTASNRIISQFDQLAATEIFVSARPGRTTGVVDPRALPWDSAQRLRQLNGVVTAGTLSQVATGNAAVSATPVRDPLKPSAFRLPVYAVSPELFPAVRAVLASGRLLDGGHSERAEHVAVLGADAASSLNIAGATQLPALVIGDARYLVIGIIREVARRPELMGGVMIPEGTARRAFALAGPGLVVVETRIGAASLIARQAAIALRPDDPRELKVDVPMQPKRVKDEVQNDLDIMFLLLGGLSLVVGAIGIANITLVGVMERTAEIGLRRAIGATRGHIAAQFLIESASMGVVGGVLGASLGVLVVVGVSAYQLWTPVLDPLAPVLAPLVGGAIGLLSGTYPALRAARLEPLEAFRHS